MGLRAYAPKKKAIAERYMQTCRERIGREGEPLQPLPSFFEIEREREWRERDRSVFQGIMIATFRGGKKGGVEWE
jgi:hypothetical protein